MIADKSDEKPAEDEAAAAPAGDADTAKPETVAVDAAEESKAE